MTTTTTKRKPATKSAVPSPTTVRVAVYTRKSTEEGMDQQFTSIDAQRAGVEAYVQAQESQGWVALPDRYDDPGYTGANTDRPGFRKLVADVEAGRVDIVAVHRIDRLSRSLLDFTSTMALFQRHGVSFVSTTQAFDTSTSVGRLTLNLLATFGQFEREMISERTSDKMRAARRRGLWCGGRPPLGFDVIDKKLVANADEAEHVRLAFRTYLEHGSLLSTCDELNRLGVRNKRWKNEPRGHAFDKSLLHRLLTNVAYRGMVTYHDEVHPGQHQAIIDEPTWCAVQEQLRSQSREKPVRTRNKWNVLLAGLVRCAVCDSALVHHYASRHGRRYSYLVCGKAQREGATACPGSRVSVRDLEAFVIDRIREMGRDPMLVAETVKAAREHLETKKPEIEAELRRLEHERRQAETERTNLATAIGQGGAAVPALLERLGQVEEVLQKASQRLDEQRQGLAALTATIDEGDLAAALAAFDEVWASLVPRERARVFRLLIEEVRFNGQTGDVELRLRPTGIRSLASESGRKSA